MIDYLKKESLYICMNDLNPLVALGQVAYVDILMSVDTFVRDHSLSKDYYNEHLIETFLYIEQKEKQQAFINEVIINTSYQFDTLDEVLNCLVLKGLSMPLGDQLPLSTFLNVYLSLIDKAEAIKNESEGEAK